jgi:transcriptional regulator with XRE-family HTH domain
MEDGMMQCGIYAITNVVTGRIYIGKTETSFATRWKMHIADLRRGTHHNVLLQAEWQKYGEDAFVLSIVEVISPENDTNYFLERERYHIEHMTADLYNWISLDQSLILAVNIRTMRTINQLIDNLFRTYRKPDNTEYSNHEAADAIQSYGYTQTNASHLAKLRRGVTGNPSRDLLLSLCKLFGVSPNYFFPELDGKDFMQPPPELPQEQFRAALRSTGLDPEDQTLIEPLIQQIVSLWKNRRKGK